jgi:signal transduction histidine kinase
MLQQRAAALETEIRQRQAVEGALRQMLEARARVEAELRASLEREQEARARAQTSDVFKEAFTSILGRELRQPLDTMLTTARLMTLRGELSADGQRRLDRVVASGLRMQRMLEQMLDLARDRWATGISVSRTAPRDLQPLVVKIVDEVRHEHPRLQIELRANACCVASVDADRFEQVVAHLLSNAATHGDAARPIQVALERSGWNVSFSVHNYGRPIAPEALPLLFEPLRRPRPKHESRAAGLGLGLYICERVVRAHGGVLRVESSEQGGTLFEATLPHCAEADGCA